jgi:hypothetical protein
VAVVIDLGEIGRDDLVAWSWRPRLEARQRLLLVAATALILVWATGSVPGIPQLTDPIWSSRAASFGFLFGPGTAYVVDPDGRSVSGLDPATGAQRWRVRLDAPAQGLVEVRPGVVALQLGPRDDAPATGQMGDLAVELIGPGGRVVAHVPGQLWNTFADGGLLVLQEGPGCDTGDCTQLSRVDPDTGAIAWSLPAQAHAYVPLQTCQDRTFAVANGDTVEIRSLATAEVLARVHVLDIDNGLLQTGVLYDDELITAELVKDGLVVNANPVGTGARAWSVTLPQGVTPNGVSAGLFTASCSGLLSAQLADSTVVIDRHGGAVRAQVQGDLFVVPAIGGPTGILLALSGPSARAARNVVLVFGPTDRAAVYPDTAILPWDGAGGRAMLTHEQNGRTGFTAIDASGRPSALGAVDGTDLTCRARADLLACRDAGGVVRVWRLPPDALP